MNKEDIERSIRIEKVTSSYSLENRTERGYRMSSFLSYTARSDSEEGWTMEEARYVEAVLSQQVVSDLYTDAFARQQLTKEQRQADLQKMTPIYEALQRARGEKARAGVRVERIPMRERILKEEDGGRKQDR